MDDSCPHPAAADDPSRLNAAELPAPAPSPAPDAPLLGIEELKRRVLILCLYAGRRTLVLVMVLGVLALCGLVLNLLSRIHVVASLVAIATLVAYVLAPAVDYLHDRKLNRIVSITLVYLAVALLLVISIAFVIPVIREQYVTFTENLSRYMGDLQYNLRGSLASAQRVVPDFLKPMLANIDPEILSLDSITAELQSSLPKIAGGALGGVLGGMKAAAGVAAGIILVPLLAFYILMDGDRYHLAFLRLMPSRWKPDVDELLGEINHVLGRYIRGQLIVCCTIGGSIAVVLNICGLEYASLIGLFAGVINIIPYVGVVFGMIPAVLIAWVNHGFLWAVGIVVAMETVHWLEGHIVVPAVIGHSVGLPPLVVMIALGAGAELGGIFGMLLAIPVSAILRVLCLFYIRKMEQLEARETKKEFLPPSANG